MLEQQNDNLQNADGNLENSSTQENLTQMNQNLKAIEEIENSNAEESEDASLAERHEIPMRDYHVMNLEDLVKELETLIETGKVSSIKEHVDEIRKEFSVKFDELLESKKEEYASNNDGETSGFEYHSPLKQKFDSLLNIYRERRNKHYNALENQLKTNLANRLAIIEELKNLVNPETNIPDLFKQFNDIKERWRNAGAIPKDKYNHVWNNYQFHVENFYDYIHLDREARDLDFKYNLEQKQKVVERAKALLEDGDLNKIFRELQLLHKLWKEELGPVSKEHRDQIWNEFSSITKQIHDKREAYYQEIRAKEEVNLSKKLEIINKIAEITTENVESHSQWQKQIQKIDNLRADFFVIGKVPMEKRDETWEKFKEITKEFNVKKNNFYRNIKTEQQNNLNKKQALLAKAVELKESTDFDKVVPVMKQIQEEWKAVGHVPKKFSDEIWKEFKEACNYFFDRLHEKRNQENSVELEAFEKKKEYLEIVKTVTLSGEHKADLDLIKSHIEHWKSIGRVPANKKHIESKFNKVLDGLFEQLSLSKKDSDNVRYNNRISTIIESDDSRKLNSERIFLTKKIEEIKSEIRQLENNVLFITSSKNNSFINEVNKSINKHKEELESWKDKLAQLNQAIKKSQESNQ